METIRLPKEAKSGNSGIPPRNSKRLSLRRPYYRFLVNDAHPISPAIRRTTDGQRDRESTLSGTISNMDGERWFSPVFYSNSVAILIHDRRPMSYVRQLVNHSLFLSLLFLALFLSRSSPDPSVPPFLASTAVVLEASRAPDYSVASSFYLARFISAVHVSKLVCKPVSKPITSDREEITTGVIANRRRHP